MALKHFVLAAVAAASLAGAANAGQIGIVDFTSPVITGFGNPDATGPVAEPLVISNYSFSAPGGDGLIWWQAGNGFADCVGGCVTDNSALALNVDLGGSYALAGLYVGQATAFSLNVAFFNAAHLLLGNVNATGAGDGVAFAGWESDADKIASIEITKLVENNFFVSAQSGYLQANGGVPEPAAWSLMIMGFGLAGAALRRRTGKAATA